MNKIKIYELLGLIKDGKAPKKIKYNNGLFRYVIDENDYFEEAGSYLLYTLLSTSKTIDFLNTEVEIIEEEKEFEDIEAFGIHYSWDYIDYKSIEELKKYVNKDFQNIFDTLDKLIKNQKKIIDLINDMRDKEC